METVTLVMQMSTDDGWATVVTALQEMPGVELRSAAPTTSRELHITVGTDDPDLVDIVREIVWQFDELATQRLRANEPACKPDPVVGDHPSGTPIAGRLVRPTR